VTATPEWHPDWHPDPFRRHELRFHDGSLWTEHVSDRGVPSIDTVPVAGGPRSRPPEIETGDGAPPTYGREAARIVPEHATPGATLLDAPVLLVAEPQRGTAGHDGLDCAVLDQRGGLLGTVRTVKERLLSRLLRMLTSANHREVSRIDLLDPQGTRLVRLDRPARRMKPRVTVRASAGAEIGEIVPRMSITRFLFTLEAGGEVVGVLEAAEIDGTGARVTDTSGRPVARTARTWEVLAARHHPDAGTHVVEVAPEVVDPLRTLAVAGLLAVDTMLAPAAP
jgi:uncharacterized protein DUF2510